MHAALNRRSLSITDGESSVRDRLKLVECAPRQCDSAVESLLVDPMYEKYFNVNDLDLLNVNEKKWR